MENGHNVARIVIVLYHRRVLEAENRFGPRAGEAGGGGKS